MNIINEEYISSVSTFTFVVLFKAQKLSSFSFSHDDDKILIEHNLKRKQHTF